MHAAAVVVVHREAEATGAARHGLPDSAHADDAQPFAPDTMAKHESRRPARPFAGANHPFAFRQAAGCGEDQGHGHVRRVFGQDTRRIGDDDRAFIRGIQIDIVDPRTEGGDQLEPFASLFDQRRVDPVGYRRDQHVGLLHRRHNFGARHRRVVQIETHFEQFHHPRFDRIGEFARYDDERFCRGHGRSLSL